MMDLFPIPAFQDNYIWALFDDEGRCLVVDPGDAAPVEAFLAREGLELTHILITHHHPDHVGGIQALLRHHDVPVYGPRDEQIPGRTVALSDGDRVTLEGPDVDMRVMEVPGHTLGHIAYVVDSEEPPLLFCGDTLFAGGCGKLFEGTPEQMLTSLGALSDLPGNTRVCCAHEYTLKNLQFAHAVTPRDKAVDERLSQVTRLRDENRVTLPSTLELERRTNPFLRVDDDAVRDALVARAGCDPSDRVALFAALRGWKDHF